MSLPGLYVALAAVSAGGQITQHDMAEVPVVQVEAVTPVTLPVTYRLPAAPPMALKRGTQQKSMTLEKIVPPPMPRDPFQTPSAELWPSNSPVRMNLVGLKFGWDL